MAEFFNNVPTSQDVQMIDVEDTTITSSRPTHQPEPTSFLDLSQELKDMIYERCNDRIGKAFSITLPESEATDDSTQTLRMVQLACPQLADGIIQSMGRSCEELHFVVTHHEVWQPPRPMQMRKLKTLTIEFDLLPYGLCETDDDPELYEQREACLTTMRENLKRFCAWFKQGRQHLNLSLAELDVKFRGIAQRHATWWRPVEKSKGEPLAPRLTTMLQPDGQRVSMLEVMMSMAEDIPRSDDAWVHVSIQDIRGSWGPGADEPMGEAEWYPAVPPKPARHYPNGSSIPQRFGPLFAIRIVCMFEDKLCRPPDEDERYQGYEINWDWND